MAKTKTETTRLNEKEYLVDTVLLAHQLSAMLKIGIPLLPELEVLKYGFPAFRDELVMVYDRVARGTTMAGAMREVNELGLKQFHRDLINQVGVGESQGSLEHTLIVAADLSEGDLTSSFPRQFRVSRESRRESQMYQHLALYLSPEDQSNVQVGLKSLKDVRELDKERVNKLKTIYEEIDGSMSCSRVSEALDLVGITPFAAYVVSIGEKTGKVTESLDFLALLYATGALNDISTIDLSKLDLSKMDTPRISRAIFYHAMASLLSEGKDGQLITPKQALKELYSAKHYDYVNQTFGGVLYKEHLNAVEFFMEVMGGDYGLRKVKYHQPVPDLSTPLTSSIGLGSGNFSAFEMKMIDTGENDESRIRLGRIARSSERGGIPQVLTALRNYYLKELELRR